MTAGISLIPGTTGAHRAPLQLLNLWLANHESRAKIKTWRCQLHVVADYVTADSPAKPLLGRILQIMREGIEESRNTISGLRSSDILRVGSGAGLLANPA